MSGGDCENVVALFSRRFRKNSRLATFLARWLTCKPIAKVSFALQPLDTEPIADTIPLTASEKRLKAELEGIVQSGLKQFIAVAQALRTLRTQRLYRQSHPTFESYCQDQFGLGRVAIDQTIRARAVAQTLLDHDVSLPPGIGEAALRPLCAFEDPDLQTACWQLADSFMPERGPTARLVTRLCHVIRDVLENPCEDDDHSESRSTGRAGFHTGPREKKSFSEPDTPFIRPLLRMSSYQNFSIDLVISHIDQLANAKSLYHAAGVMRERCGLLQERLTVAFPEVAGHA